MIKFFKEGKYSIAATKFKDENVTINIGFLGEIPERKYFIINKFKHSDENNQLFKDLIMYFRSKDKIESFVDFFSMNNYFYAVFKYKEAQNLNYKFNKKVCITDFRKRVKIFENICIKIKTCIFNNMPSPVLLTMADSKNITIDDEDNIFVNFDMRKIFSYQKQQEKYLENKNKYIVKIISKIFKTIFETEVSYKYNRIMQLIYKKCKLGIHNSIEEIVIDIKNNIEEAEISSMIEYLKYQFRIRKYLIPKITKTVLLPSIIFAVGFLIYQKLRGPNRTAGGQSLTIGEITYSGSNKDESAKSINLDNSVALTPENSTSSKSIIVPKDSTEDYEDYVVQDGDTASSISENKYSDKTLGSVITSFNGISGSLLPGTILKIPTKAFVDAYVSGNTGNNEN